MQKLPYNQSAIVIKKIATGCLNRQKKEFILDDELKRLYRLITLYFTHNPEFEEYGLTSSNEKKFRYSLHKGILLIGPPGRSKTFCFEQIFPLFLRFYYPAKRYRIVSSYGIQQAFEKEGIAALNYARESKLLRDKDVFDIYIDEIGAEQLTVSYFGNKQNPVQAFLHERHRLFVQTRGAIKTHASSNLVLNSENNSSPNLKAFYGDRIYSRLFEMFNILVTTGSDLRINSL